ncbi:MAG: hypothetical protein IKI49_02410 [Oscillospiraceae bacterium]|nr:hypothetical protein [Oscillospiraceae bacterium]
MAISEKVAYLKGLAEGLALDAETKEGKIISAIIDILEDVAYDIEDLEENALDLAEEIDAISDDLALIEDIVYDEECEDCDCFDDEDEMYTVVCPSCEEEIVVDEDILDLGEIECPNCGEKLEFDFEDDEEEDEE